jgi:hypothetical protein
MPDLEEEERALLLQQIVGLSVQLLHRGMVIRLKSSEVQFVLLPIANMLHIIFNVITIILKERNSLHKYKLCLYEICQTQPQAFVLSS